MSYSKVVTEGDGSTTTFAVNFAMDYLLESDVTCRVGSEVDGSGDPVYRDITFVSTNLLEVSGAPPGDGVAVVFERTVDKNELRVDYSNGDVMDEDNLNTSQKQLMMAVHELLDGRTGVQAVDMNLGGYKITNIGTPTDDTDAVTKAYADAGAAAAIAASAANAVATAADRVQTGLDVVASAASAASAAALFDLFDDKYLGSKTANPTLDNDGNALAVGALYWNSSVNELRVYSGSIWLAYSPTVGLADVVEDTSPQLGGNLDLNGHTITGMVIGADIQAFDATTLKSSHIGSTVQAYDEQLDSKIRQNSQSAAYTTVLADSGKHILHPSADTTARTFTIAANASVAYPIGTALTFINQNAAGVITISIASDTMRLAGAGTTGSRTLAANGVATAIKIATTEWIISGVGLT